MKFGEQNGTILSKMFPKGVKIMNIKYNEIQELLRSRADLHARLNLMPYDGTPEIKERGV